MSGRCLNCKKVYNNYNSTKVIKLNANLCGLINFKWSTGKSTVSETGCRLFGLTKLTWFRQDPTHRDRPCISIFKLQIKFWTLAVTVWNYYHNKLWSKQVWALGGVGEWSFVLSWNANCSNSVSHNQFSWGLSGGVMIVIIIIMVNK